MLSLLIKKEYRIKFKFTNFLYNELWGLCEKYMEHIDEHSDNSSKVVNALVACYNIVLYCGRTAIDDNTKVHLESFIKNQTRGMIDDKKVSPEIAGLFFPSNDNSVLTQLFNVSENYLEELKAEDLLDNFKLLREKSTRIFSSLEANKIKA